MSEGTVDLVTTYTSTTESLNPHMTRRQILRSAIAGSMALGVVALTGCGGSSTTVTNVTLVTADWPVTVIPSKADQAKDIRLKTYTDSLQKWLGKNPGVTLKRSTSNIWDQQALTAAVSGGTAPTWYYGLVLGGFDVTSTITAFARGLAADTTSLNTQYKMDGLLADYALPTWRQTWNLNGKYYGAPGDQVNPGQGIFFRRDIMQQQGIAEPQPGWKWADFRTLAKQLTSGKRHGAALGTGIFTGMATSSNQLDLLAHIPSPSTSWHWRYNYDPFMQEWVTVVSLFRSMNLDDKSVLYNTSFTSDTQSNAAFVRGDAMMTSDTANVYYQGNPAFGSVFTKQLNKPGDDIVGFVSMPVGDNGAFGGTQKSLGITSFQPRLNSTELDKAYSLYSYLFFQEGYYEQRVARYNATKDATQAYDYVSPANRFQHLPGIAPGPQEAWGTKYIQAINQSLSIPIIPDAGHYIPSDTSAGPTNQAQQDAYSALSTTREDITGILKHLEQVWNQQASSLFSNVSQSDFTNGAKKYYSALNDFWQKNAPTFAQGDYQTFYQNQVQPALGS